MIKVYTGTLIPDLPPTEILFPNLGNKERVNPFGESIFTNFTEKIVEIVSKPSDADYFLLPHNYTFVKNNHEYLASLDELASTHSKRIIVIHPGDLDDAVLLENAIVFRNSKYGREKKDNEIIMPAYAVDLGKKYGLVERPKKEKPTVSFCGWASYATPREWLSYGIFNLMQSLVGNPVKKKGLYFRRRAISLLKKSPRVDTNFIIRTSYSGNTKTLKVDPTKAREEYVNNIKDSDFTLSPKGDGNFSVRFYESLSLGRIPLLIDTDTPLPLEEEIDYSDFVLKIHYKDLPQIADIVAGYYFSLTPESYLQKQKRCREVFEKYLRIDVFFKQVMTKEFLL